VAGPNITNEHVDDRLREHVILEPALVIVDGHQPRTTPIVDELLEEHPQGHVIAAPGLDRGRALTIDLFGELLREIECSIGLRFLERLDLLGDSLVPPRLPHLEAELQLAAVPVRKAHDFLLGPWVSMYCSMIRRAYVDTPTPAELAIRSKRRRSSSRSRKPMIRARCAVTDGASFRIGLMAMFNI
jgi:hypothetical protein